MKNYSSDLPENEQSIRLQQELQKPKVESLSKPQVLVRLKPVVYKDNIRHSLASKWLFKDKCRVVSNREGFYLNVGKGRKYVCISELTGNTITSGNIWIKRLDVKGWREIVHAFCGKETTIGDIKEADSKALYKQELNQFDCMNIKL